MRQAKTADAGKRESLRYCKTPRQCMLLPVQGQRNGVGLDFLGVISVTTSDVPLLSPEA